LHRHASQMSSSIQLLRGGGRVRALEKMSLIAGLGEC
jgi:hypothetical protein